MSSWSHVDVKAERSYWTDPDHNPWKVDVVGVKEATTAHIPVHTEITYAEPTGSACNGEQCQAQDLEVTIVVPGEQAVTKCARYSEADGTVTHRSPGIEDGQPVEVLVVTSMVIFKDDDPLKPQVDWHLNGLTVKDDPNDTAVIGAQGGGT